MQSLRIGVIDLDNLNFIQIGWLTADQVRQTRFYEFHLLYANQTPWLTTAQISSIPQPGYFASWFPASRAALTVGQVQALNIAAVGIGSLTSVQISLLTPDQVRSIDIPTFGIGQLSSAQIDWLSVAQIQKVGIAQFNLLLPTQIPLLTTSQIASIPHSGHIASWSSVARAALTAAQVQSLNLSSFEIRYLTSTQIGWLSAAQIQQVRFYEFHLLQPGQIPFLSTSQITSILHGGYLASWSAAARQALTASQVQLFNMAVFRAVNFTPEQIGWMTATQVREFLFYELNLLQPVQIPMLIPAQIASIPHSGYVASWSSSARAAMTMAQVQALNLDTFEIRYLTSAQIGWLTESQVQKVRFYEFHLLQPAQIPQLTAAQIKSITQDGYLASWSAAARAALTASQVQLFDMTVFGAGRFTSQQIGWLNPAQIRALRFYDFSLLQPWQIQYLTTAQIASIPQWGYIGSWSAIARAALSAEQVKALKPGIYIDIQDLTDLQVSWLSPAQVQSLRYYQFHRLQPSQIPLLTAAQLSNNPNGHFLYSLAGELQAALTREQILSLPLKIWTEFTRQIIDPPYDYHPAEHMPIGPDGLPMSSLMQAESDRVFALVPLQTATHVTVATGNWSNPAIWRNGVVPSSGAKVVVSAGTTVQFDAFMNTAIHTLRIDGALSFSVDRNTQLKADTIVVYTTGKLHIGTEANPIRDGFTARILIADTGPINTTWDPYLLSRGLISRGEVR
ncbi:MAG: hypothetical protein H0T51_11370, partial [Pirellulales bacterium]|nr:hypothetical protein [Pirellulales bacterium]